MRIIYLSALLLGASPLIWAETKEGVPESSSQPAWQDIVRSTQARKPTEAAEPEAQKNTLYKVVDENGVPSFTDVKPTAKGVERIEVEVKPSLNVLNDKSEQRKKYENRVDYQAGKRKQQAVQHKLKIQEAEVAVQQAKARKKEGLEPAPDDWQRTAKGRRFLKESYLTRKQQLADNVKQAEKHLKDLQRQRP